MVCVQGLAHRGRQSSGLTEALLAGEVSPRSGDQRPKEVHLLLTAAIYNEIPCLDIILHCIPTTLLKRLVIDVILKILPGLKDGC